MEKLLQEATVGCPGAAEIWRGIRALMQTGEAPYLVIISNLTCVEVVQRKAVCKSIDEGLAELQEAKVSESAIGGCIMPNNVSQAPYSDDLSKLISLWAKFEEQHRTLCEEHSRAKKYCEDSFLQSTAVSDLTMHMSCLEWNIRRTCLLKFPHHRTLQYRRIHPAVVLCQSLVCSVGNPLFNLRCLIYNLRKGYNAIEITSYPTSNE